MIKDLLRENHTGRRRDTQEAPGVILEEYVKITPIDYSLENEYVLTFKYRAGFYATKANYERQRENAIDMMNHAIYGDILGDLYRALAAATNKETFDLINKVIKRIKE